MSKISIYNGTGMWEIFIFGSELSWKLMRKRDRRKVISTNRLCMCTFLGINSEISVTDAYTYKLAAI